MSMNYESKTVSETDSKDYDHRFVCQADLEKFSVELVVQCIEEGEDQGVLTVWNDKEIVTNKKVVEADLEGYSENEVSLFFENFLIGEVNKHLKR